MPRKVHLKADCTSPIQECGTSIDYILAGYTSKLQVMDVGLNKPFKDYLRECFELRMMRDATSTVSREDVSKWVERAWGRITEQQIINTWNKVGIVSECAGLE